MMIRIHNSQYCQFLHQADVLRRSGTLCDAVISVKSQTFRAHRLVLACASRTLAQKLLQGNTGEPLHCTLELFPPHTFQQVLDFSYRQAVEVPVDDLQQLLKAAQILEMQPLEEQCQAMLEKLKSPVRQVGETHKNGVEKEAREVQRTKKASEVARRHLKKEGVHHESSSPPQFETNKSLLMETPSPHETVEESSYMACAACRFCGRGYRVERSLRTCRHSYSGEKPYQCKRCPKRFSLKHQLDTHYRVHTGEKPFECRLCGQRSRDYSAMIKHLRTHGGATPYQCTVCLEFCSSLAAMQKHLKSHPVDDFPPEWNINSTYLYTSHT
ncbi:uncharacterized protein zbtb32 [Aplochiton taeniatus]